MRPWFNCVNEDLKAFDLQKIDYDFKMITLMN